MLDLRRLQHALSREGNPDLKDQPSIRSLIYLGRDSLQKLLRLRGCESILFSVRF